MITAIMVVYQYVLLVCDFVYLCGYVGYLFLLSAWYLVVPKPQKSVAGEIVLITGTGHGIGRELGVQFARLGAKVVCLDINEVDNQTTVADIGREGGTAWAYKCDVSVKEEVHAVCQKILSEIGQVTILVNNAGIMPCKSFLKHSAAEIENLFNVNVFSHFWMVREWLPFFIASNKGHVVAVSSIAGLIPTSNLVPYCSSKYAVKGLMDCLNEELHYVGRNSGIKFTCIHPFIVDTGLAKNPRIRFPRLNPITTPAECAEKIIEGIRCEDEEVCIPPRHFYVNKMLRLMPSAVQKVVLDFMDTGVDEHDNDYPTRRIM